VYDLEEEEGKRGELLEVVTGGNIYSDPLPLACPSDFIPKEDNKMKETQKGGR